MMKVLYVAHFREASGWSQAAIDNVLCLDKAGVDVTCRNIKLTDKNVDVPDRIKELESKDISEFTHIIQHVLPHHFKTNNVSKNILYLAFETNTVKYSNWYTEILMADEVWVPNHQLKNVLENDGIKTVKVVPHTFDMSAYDDEKITHRLNMPEIEHAFKFYYIGDLNGRKNLESIVRCYHSEFHEDENVALVLKVNKHGLDPSQLQQYMHEFSGQIKASLRIYNHADKFRPEIFITEYFPKSTILALHQTCDCFLNPSHGEAWSIPSFEAMAMGKTPICSNEGGPKEFIDKENSDTGSLIDGIYNVCNHPDPAFPTLFTGRDNWFVPSEKDIKKQMRFYYENRGKVNPKEGLCRANKFSYENVAKIMIKELT